jgi:radical S-adenosyl methionine domain-containing protein 2
MPGMLAAAGASKLTFVGGEPLLHPMLPQLIQAAKEAGLTTCVVTNGSRLTVDWLQDMRPHLDWLALSVSL